MTCSYLGSSVFSTLSDIKHLAYVTNESILWIQDKYDLKTILIFSSLERRDPLARQQCVWRCLLAWTHWPVHTLCPAAVHCPALSQRTVQVCAWRSRSLHSGCFPLLCWVVAEEPARRLFDSEKWIKQEMLWAGFFLYESFLNGPLDKFESDFWPQHNTGNGVK